MLKATAIQPKIDLKTSTIQKPNLKEPLDGSYAVLSLSGTFSRLVFTPSVEPLRQTQG